MKIYHKLVRDKIPEIITAQGGRPNVEILDGEAYLSELDKKLNEEVAEYQQSKELEELADIAEVICAICEARGYRAEDLQRIKAEKHRERGGFEKKIFLASVE